MPMFRVGFGLGVLSIPLELGYKIPMFMARFESACAVVEGLAVILKDDDVVVNLLAFNELLLPLLLT